MKSQVSFNFNGMHNKPFLITILKSKLKGVKYKIETVRFNLFKIYIAANHTEQEVYNVCYGIQCFVLYDNSKDL